MFRYSNLDPGAPPILAIVGPCGGGKLLTGHFADESTGPQEVTAEDLSSDKACWPISRTGVRAIPAQGGLVIFPSANDSGQRHVENGAGSICNNKPCGYLPYPQEADSVEFQRPTDRMGEVIGKKR
jgi:hypothetical protein